MVRSSPNGNIENFFTGREAKIVIGSQTVGYVSDITVRITQNTTQYLPLGTSYPIVKPTTQLVRFTIRSAYWDNRLVALVAGSDDPNNSDINDWESLADSDDVGNMDKDIGYRYKNASIVIEVNVPDGSDGEITRTITISDLTPTDYNLRITGAEIIEENIEGYARRYKFSNVIASA